MQGAVPAPPELFEMLCENITEYESSNWIFFSKDMILDIIIQIIQRIGSDIFEYVERKDYPSMDSFEDVDSFQTESRAFYSGYDTVYDLIQEEYPNVRSYEFIAQLLSDFVFSSKFIHFVSRSIPKVGFKDIFGQPSNIKTETRMFKLADDFDTFIRGERIFCCKKHSYICNYKKITSCDEEDSFNKAFYVSSDRALKSVVTYPKESI
jgi:hypothetical protein